MTTVLAALAAVLLDAAFGEPRRAHPLVAFGRRTRVIEQRLHQDRRLSGVLAWSVAVAPPVLATWALSYGLARLSPWCASVFGAFVLYLAIGHRSLR